MKDYWKRFSNSSDYSYSTQYLWPGECTKGALDATDCDFYAVLGVRGFSSPYVSLSETLSQLEPAFVETYPSSISVINVDLSSLLPPNLAYYHYQGSLTTPNCDERVQWFVLQSVINLPQTYVEKLRRIKDKHGAAVTWNYRDFQNYNGRIVTQVFTHVHCLLFSVVFMQLILSTIKHA